MKHCPACTAPTPLLKQHKQFYMCEYCGSTVSDVFVVRDISIVQNSMLSGTHVPTHHYLETISFDYINFNTKPISWKNLK